jgi:hypothetical protein
MGVNDAGEMLEVAKEECGRLEREVANLRAAEDLVNSEHADVVAQLKLTAAEDLVYVRRIEAERDAAYAAIERVQNLTGDIGPEARRILSQLPTDALAQVKADAWTEGYEAGRDDESFCARGLSSDPDAAEHPHDNPYATDALAAAHTADLQRQNEVYAATPMNEGLGE